MSTTPTARTGRTGRRDTNRLWLETSDSLIRAGTVNYVGTSDELPHLKLPFIGAIRRPLPTFLRRHLPARFVTSAYFTVDVGVGAGQPDNFYPATLCDTAAEAETVAEALLAALDEHRNRAGVLVYRETEGWTVKPFPTESDTSVGKRPFGLPKLPEHDGVSR